MAWKLCSQCHIGILLWQIDTPVEPSIEHLYVLAIHNVTALV